MLIKGTPVIQFSADDARKILGKKELRKTVYLDVKFTNMLLDIIKEQAYLQERKFIIIGQNSLDELKSLGFDVKGQIKLQVEIPQTRHLKTKPKQVCNSPEPSRSGSLNTRSYNRLSPDLIARITALLKAGNTVKSISEKLNINRNNVAKYKAKMRKKGRPAIASEYKINALLIAGKSNKEIAKKLNMAPVTIARYKTMLYKKGTLKKKS